MCKTGPSVIRTCDMVLSEMRGGLAAGGVRGMTHGIEPNNHEGLGVDYLNEFNLELCQTENIRNGEDFNEYQRQRKAAAAYLQQQQQAQQQQAQQHHLIHHQLQTVSINNSSNSSEEGLGGPPSHHILPEGLPPNVATNGILYSPTEEAMPIPNGNARHQLQIVKIMSPCSPAEEQSPTHCSQMPSSPEYRNVNLQEARTPLMSNGQQERCPEQVHHDGHLNRNIPIWMDTQMQNGGIPHLRYDKLRYQDPLDLSSVGSDSMEDGGHWIHRKQEYGQCLDSPQLYMAEGVHHHGHSIRSSHSRNQSSEGRRTPHLPNPGGISDKDLLNLAVRDLNKLLHGLDRTEITRIKQKRRTLKNRGYAQNCRMKRVDQRKALEEENRRIRRELQRLNDHCQNLRNENIYLKETIQAMSCKQQRKYDMSPRRSHHPPQLNNNNTVVHNNNLLNGPHGTGGGANNNGGGPLPSHLSTKVIEFPESISMQPTQSQPIVSSTVKDVRTIGPEGGLTHGNQATPHPDSPEPSNCYWKDER